MKLTEKKEIVQTLREKFEEYPHFYMTDITGMSVAEINELRAACYEAGIEIKVAKNTLIKRAMDELKDNDYSELAEPLKGQTSLMFTPTSNGPAKIIKKIRKNKDIPKLKAAWIEADVFIGDDKLKQLSELKSKEELIGEIIALLQSPATNVIGALKSGGSKMAGILKTLSEKSEKPE